METVPLRVGTLDSGQPVIHRHAHCIDPAPVAEVLHDQLAYLLTHSTQPCSAGCEDCARLERVKAWLLLPFGAGSLSR